MIQHARGYEVSQDIWRQCLDSLKEEFPAQQFNTWLRPLQADLRGQELFLYAPNRFVMDWVSEKYVDRIQEIAREQSGEVLKVVLKIGAAPVRKDREENSGGATIVATPVVDGSQTNVDNRLSSTAASVAWRSAKPESVDSGRSHEAGVRHQNGLNENFTFDNFVEGKSNQLARAASMQVAENPGGAYNPLFLYGGVGLGKTHLMHAIGNQILKRDPGAKVAYLRSERFVADMVKALQLNAINEFKRYYRSVDVLLIDDIQFFARKERSQEEFFHTFNALLEGGKQIILTSDRYPKEIDNMEERLKSRFGWGLTVMVEPPELETRVAILMKKAEQAKVKLTSEAAFFIAQKIRSNVRELEGALKLVLANAHFTGEEITPPFIRECLKDLLALHGKQVSLDNIQRTVAEYYKIKVSDLLSKRRTRTITRPRQVAMALAKELTNHSLPEIGEAFGGRDHTTVLHACKKIVELQQEDAGIRDDYQYFLRTLGG